MTKLFLLICALMIIMTGVCSSQQTKKLEYPGGTGWQPGEAKYG